MIVYQPYAGYPSSTPDLHRLPGQIHLWLCPPSYSVLPTTPNVKQQSSLLNSRPRPRTLAQQPAPLPTASIHSVVWQGPTPSRTEIDGSVSFSSPTAPLSVQTLGSENFARGIRRACSRRQFYCLIGFISTQHQHYFHLLPHYQDRLDPRHSLPSIFS